MTTLPDRDEEKRDEALEKLIDDLQARRARVGVVGLGYVGLPVAVTFAEAGFKVVGIDFDKDKVESINKGESYLEDVPEDRLQAVIKGSRFRAASTYRSLKGVQAIMICVPTPLADGAPDLSMVLAAGDALGKLIDPGTLVVLESTTYPGTTEELLAPRLEVRGLKSGEDFFLAFSPERIDPGNPAYGFADIPKVVGGVNLRSTRAAITLYEQVVPKTVAVAGPKEAELAKLIENTFRHVNIALVNELTVYAHDMGIDIWEAIEAAATKPFGFLPFWPGPGWGGHCIPLDPAYLSWRVRRDRSHEVRFVELAQAVNSEMPRYVIERISLMLNDQGKSIKSARVLGVGVAYKGGTADTRESPGLKVLEGLKKRGANVEYHDPLVGETTVAGGRMESVEINETVIKDYDLVVVLVPQHGIDWDVMAMAPCVLDCCNALGKRGGNVVRL
jgi:nucleotide sugar dehydrogenase